MAKSLEFLSLFLVGLTGSSLLTFLYPNGLTSYSVTYPVWGKLSQWMTKSAMNGITLRKFYETTALTPMVCRLIVRTNLSAIAGVVGSRRLKPSFFR